METFVKLACVIVLLAQVQSDRDVVEVKVDEASALDLSKTDLTTTYCQTKNSECPGENIAKEQFAANAMQCASLCSRNLKCLSAFYTNDKICNLRGDRCDKKKLKSNQEGIDLYRLKKTESCPADRPQLVPSSIKYSNKFCVWRGKACPKHNMYPKPQMVSPIEECLKKCAKINDCAGIDYYTDRPGSCEIKDYACPDAELVDDKVTINYIRLVEGVTNCPSNRNEELPPPDTPEPVPEPKPEPKPEPVPEPVEKPKPKTCSFYKELQDLMAKYPDGCASTCS